MSTRLAGRLLRLIFLLLIAFIALRLAKMVEAQTNPVLIHWERDGAGYPLHAGQRIDTEFYGANGVSMTVSAKSATNAAVIFDSSYPTVGDFDLGAPNETCNQPGPGAGAGGQRNTFGQNCAARHNLLVIADNLVDLDGDGLIDNPGDDENGGILTFTFSEIIAVDSVVVVDQESGKGVTVNAYSDAEGATLINSVTASGLGDNSVERLTIRTLGVRRLDFDFPAGGAIDTLIYKPMNTTRVQAAGIETSGISNQALLFALPLLLLFLMTQWWFRWLDTSGRN